MPIYHTLAVTELSFLFLFYSKLLFRHNQKRFKLLLLPVLLFNVVDTLFIEGIYSFNSISWSLNTIIFIILGLLYFYRLYDQADQVSIETYPNFYINAGFLVYASGSLFTYLLAWKILSQPAYNFFHSGWLIQSVATISRNIVVTYGLWLTKRS